MTMRELEKLRFIIKDATELDISYMYDDLVFPETTAFILQFDKTSNDTFHCHFQKDCPTDERDRIFNSLELSCNLNDCTLHRASNFFLTEKGEELEITFS